MVSAREQWHNPLVTGGTSGLGLATQSVENLTSQQYLQGYYAQSNADAASRPNLLGTDRADDAASGLRQGAPAQA